MGGGSATRKEQMLVFGFPRAASTHDGREKLFVPPSNDGAYGVWMPVRCKKKTGTGRSTIERQPERRESKREEAASAAVARTHSSKGSQRKRASARDSTRTETKTNREAAAAAAVNDNNKAAFFSCSWRN